jgi:arsenite oxidase large subunit
MFAYEKGLIWGNDNYRTNGALVNIALATGNVGRPGGGCVRMGGHQEGYVRPDYRPAYNSEVHATRDMGVGELNNCYEDAELADTIVAVGTNVLETQTNYFLNHWLPNLRGTTADKKRQQLPNEQHGGVRVVIIDPRRTVTVNACEDAAGKANVLHLALESGTDLILFNALMTEIAAKGWLDRDFIGKSTTGFDEMLAANKVGIFGIYGSAG